MTLTRKQLNKLDKPDLVDIILQLQSEDAETTVPGDGQIRHNFGPLHHTIPFRDGDITSDPYQFIGTPNTGGYTTCESLRYEPVITDK